MSPARKTVPRATRPHMPGYGLPKSKEGLLPWKWAEQRLTKSHNYWITTVHPDGSPHSMVVWGLWMGGAFYFSTGKTSRKARNLARNRRCIVSTERAHEAVIVEGKARVLKGKLLPKFFTLYQKKYEWDMSAMQSQPVYEVKPVKVFGLYEKKFQNAATRWLFS